MFHRGETKYINMIMGENLLPERGGRPLTQRLRASLKSGEKFNHLVLATSGSGKTSAIAELGRSEYVLYIKCTSSGGAVRESKSYDAGFGTMVENYYNRRGLTGPSNVLEAKRAASIELMCRLAQLHKLLDLIPGLTPWQYFVHQQLAGDEWTGPLRKKLMNLSQISCNVIVRRLLSSIEVSVRERLCKLVIAVD